MQRNSAEASLKCSRACRSLVEEGEGEQALLEEEVEPEELARIHREADQEVDLQQYGGKRRWL
jgi:hypothetical protein